MLESVKKLSKVGIDLQPFQTFKTIRSAFYFQMGIGNSNKSFQSKFIVRRYLKYSWLKGQGYSCYSESNSRFQFAWKVEFL